MKKIIIFLLGIALILIGFIVLLTCLNSILLIEDITVPVEVSIIDASAVLMLTNKSKTVNVTGVIIAQPEWTAPAESTMGTVHSGTQPSSVLFTNKPKRLEKKAQYLIPSDKNYQITVNYTYDAWKNIPAGTGSRVLSVSLPLPREVEEVVIYRAGNGEVIVHWQKDIVPAPEADPDDTGIAAKDPLLGEGSSPAMIPPENRDKIAALVVVSKTGSGIIDSVNFKMGSAEYTMGEIGVHDRKSIALGRGTWETNLKYTHKGITKTCAIISTIAPPKDPHAAQEQNLYFYLNKYGNYTLSQSWPPFPNDTDEKDILPPDTGYGRSVIKIINNSYATAEEITIYNLQSNGNFPRTVTYHQFTPSTPTQYNKTSYVEVPGTPEFPIEAHEGYLIQIMMKNSEGIGIIEKTAYIKDKIVTIVIAAGDIHMVE